MAEQTYGVKGPRGYNFYLFLSHPGGRMAAHQTCSSTNLYMAVPAVGSWFPIPWRRAEALPYTDHLPEVRDTAKGVFRQIGENYSWRTQNFPQR